MVIASPSGGGKTAVRGELLKRDKRFRFSITCTTRPARPGEVDGKDYYFVTPARFAVMRKSGALLEWAQVHGNMYGTPVRSVMKLLGRGFIPVMTIDVKGAHSVKRIFPETVTVFLLPPDLKTLAARLRKRREPAENIKVRLRTAKKELKEAGFFDYLVINDRLEEAVSDIRKIADTECMKVSRRLAEAKKFGRELSRLKL
ncbi:MAG: guanylate kinase [Elusimicrobia bacterium RIFOXYB2_FULL_62_6]|nr:MAG: guanylate kinase [Elusimicrobia bacterium RIFOXYB2_FULL_62_6]